MTDETVDLEVVRDEKCVPVAKAILKDLALLTDEDSKDIVMKALRHALNADLNVQTENDYTFRLIISAFSAFSTLVQRSAIPEIDNDRFAGIEREIMELFTSVDLPLGKDATPESQETALEPIKSALEAIFIREKLTWLELRYMMEDILNSIKVVEGMFSKTVDQSTQRMEAKLLGIESMGDLTMKRLDAALTAE